MVRNTNFTDERAETNKNHVFIKLSWLIGMGNASAFELKVLNSSAMVLMLFYVECGAGEQR